MPWPGTKSPAARNGPLPTGRIPNASGSSKNDSGQREERVVAEGDRELRERRAQGDGEGPVVDDLQPAQLGGGGLAGRLAGVVDRGLQVAVALDVGEEVGARLRVGAVGGVVPGVDEGLGGDRRPVVEGPAVVQPDGPRDAVVGLDGVGHPGVADRAVRAVLDQPGPERLEDLGAVLLDRVAREERADRLADRDADRLRGVASPPVAAAPQPLSSTMPVRTATFERSGALEGCHVVPFPRPRCRERRRSIGATADAAVLTDIRSAKSASARPRLSEIWVISTPPGRRSHGRRRHGGHDGIVEPGTMRNEPRPWRRRREPPVGIEPTTFSLRVRCSTD